MVNQVSWQIKLRDERRQETVEHLENLNNLTRIFRIDRFFFLFRQNELQSNSNDTNIFGTMDIRFRHHYENKLFNYIVNILPPKNENFQIKNLIFFLFLLKNITCGYSLEPPRRGGSNEYPQPMFLSRNKKNNVYPCNSQFYYKIVGFKGVKIILVCFHDGVVRATEG